MTTGPGNNDHSNGVLKRRRRGANVMAVEADASIHDRELLRCFAHDRDEQAFEGLVKRHGPRVQSLCRRLLRDPQEAEDAFQATFMVLACKAASIRKVDSIGSWLYGVASRLARKIQTKAGRRRKHEQRSASRPAVDVEPPDLSWRETCQSLHEEMGQLPDKQRAPILLCYFDGMTQDEAARRLGWPRGTLKRRLEDGRERLRARLARRGLALSAVFLAALVSESEARAALSPGLVAATVHAGARVARLGPLVGLVSPIAAMLAAGTLRSAIGVTVKSTLASLMVGACVTWAVMHPVHSTAQADEKPPRNCSEVNATLPSTVPSDKKPTGPAAPGDIQARPIPVTGPRIRGVM